MDLTFINPNNIIGVRIKSKDKWEYQPYRKKTWYRSTPYFTFAGEYYKTVEDFCADFPDIIFDENNVAYKKPYIYICTTDSESYYKRYYDTESEAEEALKVLLQDMRTCGCSTVRLNRLTESGPYSI